MYFDNEEQLNNKVEQNTNFDLQKELMNSFFNGFYYITFDNEDETKEFMKYIEFYDLRYKDKKDRDFSKYKEVAWKFTKILHHHQLGHSNIKGYFKTMDVDMEELKFCKVADYIKKINELRNSDTAKILQEIFDNSNTQNDKNKDLFEALKKIKNKITKNIEKCYGLDDENHFVEGWEMSEKEMEEIIKNLEKNQKEKVNENKC